MKKHIRILSPSGAIDNTYIDIARARLESWGYEVSIAEHAYDRHGRFAASDNERVTDWLDAVNDTDVDIIICSRGGYGLQRIIDRTKPTSKLVVGFSDITELIQRQCCKQQVSIHGLMCKHIATLAEDSEEITLWRQAIDGNTLHYELPAHTLNRAGQVSGRLIGGNLSVLYGLQGTPYSIDSAIYAQKDEDVILFLEDISERHYHIDRMMQNLRLSGVLSRIKGLIVGQFSDCEEDPLMGESVYETILRAVKDYDYPVLFDFPAGHVEHNLPLRMGGKATLTVQGDKASLSC